MRIHHIALRSPEPERSARFYRDVLGLGEIRRETQNGELRSVWLSLEDAVLMVERTLRGTGPESGSGHLLAFAVDDLLIWEKRLQDHGIAVDDRTTYTLYIHDPDGHRIGLSTYGFARETA
jgi:catechol 2,3-dioxygenase-like lactoylglutathione lyase family enzyme